MAEAQANLGWGSKVHPWLSVLELKRSREAEVLFLL